MYDVVTPIYGWISIGWGNTNDNGFLKEKLVRLCDVKILLQLWWLVLGDELQLKHSLWLYWVGVGMMTQLKCLDYVKMWDYV